MYYKITKYFWKYSHYCFKSNCKLQIDMFEGNYILGYIKYSYTLVSSQKYSFILYLIIKNCKLSTTNDCLLRLYYTKFYKL